MSSGEEDWRKYYDEDFKRYYKEYVKHLPRWAKIVTILGIVYAFAYYFYFLPQLLG